MSANNKQHALQRARMYLVARLVRLGSRVADLVRTHRASKTNLRKSAGLAVAVTTAVLVSAAFWLVSVVSDGMPTGGIMATGSGIITAELSDGSHVYRRAGSTLNVSMDNERRVVRLVKGEATFDIAEDSKKVFVLKTPRLDAFATRAKFRVLVDDIGEEVKVFRGSVRISVRGTKMGVTLHEGEVYRVYGGPTGTVVADSRGRMVATFVDG
jgi:ferric-dicitrate binding protein FerR (iron transport regulator)